MWWGLCPRKYSLGCRPGRRKNSPPPQKKVACSGSAFPWPREQQAGGHSLLCCWKRTHFHPQKVMRETIFSSVAVLFLGQAFKNMTTGVFRTWRPRSARGRCRARVEASGAGGGPSRLTWPQLPGEARERRLGKANESGGAAAHEGVCDAADPLRGAGGPSSGRGVSAPKRGSPPPPLLLQQPPGVGFFPLAASLPCAWGGCALAARCCSSSWA